MSFHYLRSMPTPEEIRTQLPLNNRLSEIKEKRDKIINRILTGEDDRFLVIIGPCSADNEDAVLEYISRLAPIADRVSHRLMIVPRIYTNKPRTTGEGYKGIASQPDPTQEPDMLEGLLAMRRMHIRAIADSELTCADEMLYPEKWG
ncbi:MAG: 3-deoxy-7-phosphoheptulonate synthase, partial [Lachnospiraceae bacterium]|nr:3-deoxy-7-phosphoheptulonate synthase [Lachnospiraceae bacterium]